VHDDSLARLAIECFGLRDVREDAAECRVDWRFTTTNARIKPRRLYPVIEPVNSTVSDH